MKALGRARRRPVSQRRGRGGGVAH
jgi:hypothetical protein